MNMRRGSSVRRLSHAVGLQLVIKINVKIVCLTYLLLEDLIRFVQVFVMSVSSNPQPKIEFVSPTLIGPNTM